MLSSSPRFAFLLYLSAFHVLTAPLQHFCNYCTRAKKLFEAAKVPFSEVLIDDRGLFFSSLESPFLSLCFLSDDCTEIQQVLGGLTGASTVPRVFVGGKSFGGYTGVCAFLFFPCPLLLSSHTLCLCSQFSLFRFVNPLR